MYTALPPPRLSPNSWVKPCTDVTVWDGPPGRDVGHESPGGLLQQARACQGVERGDGGGVSCREEACQHRPRNRLLLCAGCRSPACTQPGGKLSSAPHQGGVRLSLVLRRTGCSEQTGWTRAVLAQSLSDRNDERSKQGQPREGAGVCHRVAAPFTYALAIGVQRGHAKSHCSSPRQTGLPRARPVRGQSQAARSTGRNFPCVQRCPVGSRRVLPVTELAS